MSFFSGKKFLVCRAKHTWSYPDQVHTNRRFFYVGDDRDGYLFGEDRYDMEGLAGLLPPDLEPDNIDFEPPIEAQTLYADGYWGRPVIPVEVYAYRPLTGKQRTELKSILSARLREAV